MKRGRLFAKIIYYAFTFLFGIVLAIGLPSYYAAFDVPGEYVRQSLENGEYEHAMTVVANSYNKRAVAQSEGADGAVVLYEGVLEKGAVKEDEESPLAERMLYKSYVGFIFAPDFGTFSATNNQTALVITQTDGTVREISLLDYDSDGNGSLDGISTVTQNGFIILDINEQLVDSIGQIAVRDKDGKIFWTSPTLSLNFESPYFGCFDKIPEYNKIIAAYQDENADADVLSRQLEAVFKEFQQNASVDADYYLNSTGASDYAAVQKEIRRIADKRAVPVVLIYFVAIYVIGDFLLGNFYIVRFFKWFLFKVCKIPHKEKKAPAKDEVFGHDYNCMVTLSLDVTDVPDFNGSVEIKYTNSDAEVKFTLLRSEGYKATQRIKAGVYVNPFIDIDRNYAPVDLPDNLEVEGYRMEKTVKITKRQ